MECRYLESRWAQIKRLQLSLQPFQFPLLQLLPVAAQLEADRARFARINDIRVLQRRREGADVVELIRQVACPELNRPIVVARANADAGVKDRERTIVRLSVGL